MRAFKVFVAVVAFSLSAGVIGHLCTGPVEAQPQQSMVRNDPVAGQSLKLYPVTRIDASLTTPITYGGPGRTTYDTVSQCVNVHRGDAGTYLACPYHERIVIRAYKMAYATANTITVSPRLGSQMILRMLDGTLREYRGTLTFDITNVAGGDNALDAGVEAANTWYYLYAVPKTATTFTTRGSTTSPIAGGPAGVATYRYLGAFRNDAGSNIVVFYHLCGHNFRRERIEIESGAGLSALAQVSLATCVPVTASAASLATNMLGALGTWTAYVDTGAGAGIGITFHNSGVAGTALWASVGEAIIPTPAAAKGYYRVIGGVAVTSYAVYCNGWIDEYVDVSAAEC